MKKSNLPLTEGCFSKLDVKQTPDTVPFVIEPIGKASTVTPEESEEAVRKHNEKMINYLSNTLNDDYPKPF